MHTSTARVAATDEPDDGLSGLTGLMADVIDALGEVGVGLLTFVESVFPPIPSEIVLSLSGYLAERGRMNVVWVIVAATLGALAGALVLYGLGAVFGEERARRWLTKLPLVAESDFDRAAGWFHRHDHGVVFFGRFIPIVRSLVSLPAGAERMPLLPFVLLTAIGSLIWNTALVGAGYALGTQYERVEHVLGYLDYLIYAAVIVLVGWVVLDKRRSGARRRQAASAPGRHRA